MSLTTIILLVLLLYLLQIFLQETSRHRFNLWTIVGNRDTPPDMSVLAGRLDRAKNNMLESLPAFLGLALLALVRGGGTAMTTQAASVFLIARILYVPAYISGIPMLRSLIWLVSVAAMGAMALPLIGT